MMDDEYNAYALGQNQYWNPYFNKGRNAQMTNSNLLNEDQFKSKNEVSKRTKKPKQNKKDIEAKKKNKKKAKR